MGPGLLYAAAAIGVSHVVQSTRAGAQFGYELVWAIVLANFFKYPFFKAGPVYSAATGKTLLSGYRKLGAWTIPLFLIVTVLTMFVVQSAITIVTAGLAQSIFGNMFDIQTYALIILLVCAAVLALGKYEILDNFIKVIVLVLTITTVMSAIFGAFADVDKTVIPASFDFSNKAHLFFLVALIGWMPAPMDIPVWQSVWTVAKTKSSNGEIGVKESVLDFKIGFITTAVLAIFFVSLGAMIMHGTGATFENSAGGFANQFINLYTQALGSWARPIIAIAAFSTMFSTCLACLDAFSRISQEGVAQLGDNQKLFNKRWYFFWLQIIVIGALCVLYFYLKDMKGLVDFATTLSFLVAPVFAILNTKVMLSKELDESLRYKGWELYLCYFGIVIFSLFAFYYLFLRFF